MCNTYKVKIRKGLTHVYIDSRMWICISELVIDINFVNIYLMSLFYIDSLLSTLSVLLALIGLCLQSSDRECVSHLDKLSFGVFICWFHLQPGLQTLLQYRPGHRIAAFLRHYALTPVSFVYTS